MNRKYAIPALAMSAMLTALPAAGQTCTPQWIPMPPGTSPSWIVEDFVNWKLPGSQRDVLVAAGSFQFAGALEVGYIAAWDGSSWQTLGGGIGGTGMALASFHHGGPGYPEMLIVGGTFSSAGGQPAARIAAWDGQEWHALGSGLSNRVQGLAVYQNQLYVGGWFAQAGGMSSPYLARWGCPQPPPCYADCDQSGGLDINDFLCFINEFAAADALPPAQQITHYANCTGSTQPPILSIDDFLCFINEFAAGCP